MFVYTTSKNCSVATLLKAAVLNNATGLIDSKKNRSG